MPAVPPVPEQYPEPPRPQYATEAPGRTQSPGRQQRYPPAPTPPQHGHGRTSSAGGPQGRMDPPPNNRHSSYGPITGNEYRPDSRKSSHVSNASVHAIGSQPSLASLANAADDGYYSPPVRPQTGSRPVSQGSLSSNGPPPPRPETAASTQSTGTGPKTFQEMGVKTHHKKDSDCVVM
jgi:hypothetical protein